MAIVLDTCVLPQKGPLRSIIMSAVLRVAEKRKMAVYLPEIALEESVSARRRSARASFDALQAAHKEASKYFTLDPIYIPDEDEVAQKWDQELRGTFKIIRLYGEDASEALRREAHRIKPARDGIGARDSAIWLAVKRHHQKNGGPTYFVTNNSSDFSGSNKRELHGNLSEELGESGGADFFLFNQLDEVVTELAERADVTLKEDAIVEFEEDFVDVAMSAAVEDLNAKGDPAHFLSFMLQPARIIRTIRSYKVDDVYLVMAEVSLSIEIDHEPDDVILSKIKIRTWVEQSVESGDAIAVFAESFVRDE
ncbi:PIN domain-containing protein [Lentzea sp. NBC_00516]|uniref:PIN domain-containing protein n=1 Tax=Lentzea sp. NBC_00516 TaxID=2903582 RepID=UPI002E802491|nr:PIN domain-containing protein [Lentzea sp. NBC_00516]WUD22154.1 PIN domain-containing protein [Lentzea sp. NBC_00516]